MSIDKIGAVVARGLGLGLIIMALSSLCSVSFFLPTGLVTISGQMADFTGIYHVIRMAAGLYGPFIMEAVAGVLMISFSRFVGRWLTRGLDDNDQRTG